MRKFYIFLAIAAAVIISVAFNPWFPIRYMNPSYCDEGVSCGNYGSCVNSYYHQDAFLVLDSRGCVCEKNRCVPGSFSEPIFNGQDKRCAGSARCFNGTVTKITDGDTIEVDNTSIRLALVDAPERGEVGWNESKDVASLICPVGTSALVDEDDGQEESYGRIVAKVYCGEFDLNRMMIESGHAASYEYYCNVSEFSGERWTGC